MTRFVLYPLAAVGAAALAAVGTGVAVARSARRLDDYVAPLAATPVPRLTPAEEEALIRRAVTQALVASGTRNVETN